MTGDGNTNYIAGGLGNDNLTGGGWDMFIFETGTGTDTIFDFQDGLDLMDVSSMDAISSLADFSYSETNGNTTLTYGTDSITLIGTNYTDLSDADFLF